MLHFRIAEILKWLRATKGIRKMLLDPDPHTYLPKIFIFCNLLNKEYLRLF
ncbi:hypothetical protein YDYSY3_39070 [Paenibacillus chitinolyticus]|nr:hypothetical protein YDYSY3_39070 [Paenibacillus chitinolyticus]